MTVTINGSTGIDKVQDGTIVQADLATNVAGNGPAFSVELSTNQSVTTATFTKLAFATETFDTNSNFDTSTYRFTPTVAGHYQIDIHAIANTSVTQNNTVLYKNGSLFKGGATVASSALGLGCGCSAVIYMNGSTDYIEGYVYLSGTTPAVSSNNVYTYMSGALLRAA